MAFMAWYSRLHYEIKAETVKLTSKLDLFLNDKEKALECLCGKVCCLIRMAERAMRLDNSRGGQGWRAHMAILVIYAWVNWVVSNIKYVHP